ncbi:hypothetical protein FQR65_LT04293 [Abscondita terminalis]|nr:hypothetical protein FQR65_LT04293 [Abscondita terminalis]
MNRKLHTQYSTETLYIDMLDKNERGSCAYIWCHPKGSGHNFAVLCLMCLLGSGSYFCFDTPSALLNIFKEDLNITSTQFSLFYSLYSWPTVILCVVGGILVDSVFGIRLGANIYMAITLIGQICFATGALFNVFWVMVLGRFIFGIGAEPLAVAQNNYAVLWFKGKELNMVFGVQLSFARLGSAANFWVMESVYHWVEQYYKGHECLGIVLYIACISCVLSMICSLILGCIDKRAERILRRNENTVNEIIRFKDVKGFNTNFWLITIICVAYYIAIFVFISLGKEFFMKKFNMAASAANQVNSMVYLISSVGSPVLGLVVDKLGRNLFWTMLAISSTLCAHYILAFSMWNPYIGMVFMGIAYSLLASSLWPLVSLIIPEHQLGTAYGICQSIQNLGLAIGTIFAGMIIDNYGYLWLEVFFICNLFIALISSIIMLFIDTSKNGPLNMTPSQRERHQQTILAAQVLEREKLLSAGVTSSASSEDLLQPNSDFHIRNRYLSRIGAPLPSHYDINMKGLAYRALR